MFLFFRFFFFSLSGLSVDSLPAPSTPSILSVTRTIPRVLSVPLRNARSRYPLAHHASCVSSGSSVFLSLLPERMQMCVKRGSLGRPEQAVIGCDGRRPKDPSGGKGG